MVINGNEWLLMNIDDDDDDDHDDDDDDDDDDVIFIGIQLVIG